MLHASHPDDAVLELYCMERKALLSKNAKSTCCFAKAAKTVVRTLTPICADYGPL